ncbi:sterol desaturase family protein [Moheibacter sediminis]|uniref:Sterol desaturase/sphingolipid hydroxylase, fatty acid hydroxylase superfamily n=1 Tax=Moheibacter sediminis TaxID=1434700 RepID=A0A1W2AZF6_9FLAO|nr:sterol desaturase family protein [Moheibacter sediminis]SMC66083.1 Sterol desaturase/sphingolipid hydroxylase, fatty acid hydroxylase superfamily [Moheibacter sediminis]
MENVNYLAFALPAFFLFLFIEYQVAKLKKRDDIFKYESSISNISIGIAERLLNLFIAASFYQLFYFIYENFALFQIPNNWITWIALILATDFVWYWYHRLGHEINFLWAAHIVHHQSEEFNLTVAARITTLQALIRNVFWCVLPFFGFHPALVIFILLFHGIYSFFTHTQMIGKMKWLEYIFISPSLHGVHHASDEKYLDKNYGDVFVFWDKMFGTFQKEEEKPNYGLTHPIKSYSFLWQHFHYYLEIWEAIERTNGFKNKLKVIFGSPAVMDQDIRPMLEKKWLPNKDNPNYHFRYKSYLNFQIGLSFLLMSVITYYFDSLSSFDKYFGTFFILITLINCGALMEQRKWIYYLEYLRIISLISYVLISFGYAHLIFVIIAFFIVIEQIFRLSIWYKSNVLKINE